MTLFDEILVLQISLEYVPVNKNKSGKPNKGSSFKCITYFFEIEEVIHIHHNNRELN